MASTTHYGKAGSNVELRSATARICGSAKAVHDDRVRWSARRSIAFALLVSGGLWGAVFCAAAALLQATG